MLKRWVRNLKSLGSTPGQDGLSLGVWAPNLDPSS